MRILLLDEEKITKLNLPEEIDGIFTMKYKILDSTLVVDFNFEAKNGKWVLDQNNYFNILLDNGSNVSSIDLKDYFHFKIFLFSNESYLDIWSVPSIDKESFNITTNSDKIIIGSTSQSHIIFNNLQQETIFSGICSTDGKWYLSKNDGALFPTYLNDKVVKDSIFLKTGDIIFVNGLKIIWMKHFIRVSAPSDSVTFNSFYLTSYDFGDYNNTKFQPTTDDQGNIDLYKIEDYFFHTPNLKQHLAVKEILIDPPPQHVLPPDNGLITTSASITMLASSFTTGFNLINNIYNGASWVRIVPIAVTFIAMLFGAVLMPKFAKIYNKRVLRKKEAFRIKKYTQYLEYKAQEIITEMNKQTQILKDNHPSIQTCIKTFNRNSSFVWSREIKDEDFLEIRTGIGNREAMITINAPEEHFTLDEDELFKKIYYIVSGSRTLTNVPITFSLLKNRIAALICKGTNAQCFIDSFFAQIFIYHSAADLKIVFLNSKNSSYDFSYAKYMPHCFNEDKSVRFYSENNDEMKILSNYLLNIYKNRVDKKSQSNNEEIEVKEEKEAQKAYRKYDTYYLIVTNDFMNAKTLPITEALLNADDNYGFSYLIIDNSMKKLPNQCKAFVNIIDGEGGIMERNLNNQTIFTPEFVNLDMRSIGTQLLNIPLLEVDEQSSLPNSLSFLEMFDVSKIEQLNIFNRWKSNDPTVSLATPIGLHSSGEVFTLDLHEKFQGPHGLIAGSTGSGKSEFIITYILSMCVNYHPDEVQFVLIDYKGGGLAGAFEKKDIGKSVPHIAGTITNLDAGQINRSLVSINSELKRRQRIFNDSKTITGESTIDIYKYQKYYREGIVKEPISHLFIISDEFAELKAQQPEFMNELVSTARIGRSLGVHLILATQKPSGVVNEQIWSNTRFRVCLKVASKSDSMEMLKRPEAASIKETGRFYLQVGYDEYFDIGQSGWAGSKYIPSDRIIKKVDDSITFISNTGEIIKSTNNIVKAENTLEMGDQLTNITKYLIDFATKNNYVTKKLWLDNIPEYIYIGNLAQKYEYKANPYIFNPIIGEYDDPENQKQDLLTLDLTNNGNTLIYGSSGAGQDNLLSTIIYSTSIYHSPEEINFYVIDLGAETLKVFNKTPHVGDICTLDDTEKITNLLVMLDSELDNRKQLFSDFNGEYNYFIKKSGKKLPFIVCIINNYDVFLENFRKMGELLEPFYRECSKYGIVFILTCSTGTVVRSKVAEYFRNKMCLRMGKDEDYRNILGAPKGLIPENYKGRGVVKLQKNCYEFQTAYIYTPDSIIDIIKSTSEKISEKYNYFKAKRVPVLPDVVTLDDVESSLNGLNAVPIGFDISTKAPYTFDFTKERINIISTNILEDSFKFVYALSTLLASISNLDVYLIDFTKTIDVLKTGGKLTSTDFDSVITSIYNDVQNESSLSTRKLYFFVGLANIKDVVSAESYNLYKKIMTNSNVYKNTFIIILDEYNNLKKLQVESWYLSNVNKNIGIWIGEGVGSQTAITFRNLPIDFRKMAFNDMAFVSTKNTITPIRIVVAGMEDEINEK